MRSAGLIPHCFAGAAERLASGARDDLACVVTDPHAGISGIELQAEMSCHGWPEPVTGRCRQAP